MSRRLQMSMWRWSKKSSLLVIHYRKLIDELTINRVRRTPYQEHPIHHLFEDISFFSRFIRLGLPVSNIHLLKTSEDVSGCVVYA